MTSPELLSLMDQAKSYSSTPRISKKYFQMVQNIFNTLQKIEPEKDFNDLRWSLWFHTQRGKIQDWGSFNEEKKEGSVVSYKEFKEIWLSEFPEPVQWHRFIVTQTKESLFLSIDDTCQFSVSLEDKSFNNINTSFKGVTKLFKWMELQLDEVLASFLKNQKIFQTDLERRLPLKYRYGKVKRHNLWKAFPEIKPLHKLFGAERLQILRNLVQQSDYENQPLREMTLKMYLEACEICYLANEYKNSDQKLIRSLTPMVQYKAMADGRHDGLLKLPYKDPVAFDRWLNQGSQGGHPWEIVRGGNSTHIDFAPHKTDRGWIFYLSGLSYSRCLETVKMAVALHQCRIPFILFKKEAMLRMVAGEDFVGIVPYDCSPRYCHSEFPEEDKIEDFMNLPVEEKDAKILLPYILWYPLLTLRKT